MPEYPMGRIREMVTGIICLIKTIYRTLCSQWFWEGIEISGHDYIEQDSGFLKCEICGKETNV